MPHLDAYVSSYVHFLSFLEVLECCEPLFEDLGFLSFDFETWEELLKGFERV